MKKSTKKKLTIAGICVLAFAILVIIAVSVLVPFYGFTEQFEHKTPKDSDIRVACVGDSITYGMGVSNHLKNDYPSVLNHLLGENYCVNNYGVSGATAMSSAGKPYETLSQYQIGLDFNADIVVIMFGSNDSKVQNYVGKQKFKDEYRTLIEKYLALSANPKVYICTIADGFSKSGKGDPLAYDIVRGNFKDINDAVFELSQELNLGYIDINALTLGHEEWYILDGIHPNAYGASQIAHAVYDDIK